MFHAVLITEDSKAPLLQSAFRFAKGGDPDDQLSWSEAQLLIKMGGRIEEVRDRQLHLDMSGDEVVSIEAYREANGDEATVNGLIIPVLRRDRDDTSEKFKEMFDHAVKSVTRPLTDVEGPDTPLEGRFGLMADLVHACDSAASTLERAGSMLSDDFRVLLAFASLGKLLLQKKALTTMLEDFPQPSLLKS